MVLERINPNENLRKSYPKINAAIDAAEKADNTANEAKTTADQAANTANSVQEQFNQVVIEGDSSLEAAQARVKADGTSYDTLQERLNDTDTQLEATEKQMAIPSYQSPINKFGNKQKPFTRFKQGLLRKKVDVTIWSDSLGTGGDKLGINSSTPSGTEFAPNGIVNSEGYSHIIEKEMSRNFPNVVFNFHNRGIGGTGINEWNSLKTINSVEKTWIEHIKDTQPDILFIGFGMNHNSYSNSKTFASNIKKIYDYIYANFTKIPDIVIVTSPTSVYIEGNTAWSNDLNQESRRNTGKAARYFGVNYIDYVIDVSRFSDISRFGKDLESISFEEKTDYTKTGSNALLALNDLLKINGKYRDFTLKFTLNVTNATDGEYLLLKYNRDIGDIDLNNQLAIFPNKGGVTKIESYGRIADSTNLTYLTSSYSHTSVLTAVHMRIEKRGNVLKIFTGDIPETLVLYDDKIDVNNVLGSIEFVKQGGSVSNLTVNNLRFFEPKYVEHKKTITEEEMWGKFVDGDYSTKPITGGNGVNHPSSRGIAQVYGAPILEFISDVTRLSKSLSEIDLDLYKDDITFAVDAVALSGYCFGNLNDSDVLIFQGFVYNANKSIRLKRNERVSKSADRTLLSDGEYGIYRSGGFVQIIFKNTMGATGYATQFIFNTYKFMT